MLVYKGELTHYPVLLKEVMESLNVHSHGVYLDVTFGGGGHSREILKRLSPVGRLIVMDLDDDAIERARKLAEEDSRVTVIKGNFGQLKEIYKSHIAPTKINGIVADLGLSAYLLFESGKGFSFKSDEPLDMRFGDGEISAREVINSYSLKDLERIFREYGEEEKAFKIAKKIVAERKRRKIETTQELVNVILSVKGKKGRIHPATKVFQAIRIEVNNEMENLKDFLEAVPEMMKMGGRIVVITYHSLEDRIVKNFFKEWEKEELGYRVNKKVITPGVDELRENPSSRSAKLRTFEFRGQG